MKLCRNSQQTRSRIVVLLVGVALLLQASCIKNVHQIARKENQSQQATNIKVERININTATQEELEKLPSIGKTLATRIIEHRQFYGRFRRTEHLILVKGMSDKKYRALRQFVTIE